jgi:hypothetical protein
MVMGLVLLAFIAFAALSPASQADAFVTNLPTV